MGGPSQITESARQLDLRAPLNIGTESALVLRSKRRSLLQSMHSATLKPPFVVDGARSQRGQTLSPALLAALLELIVAAHPTAHLAELESLQSA
jgi:hypothetical protein